MGKGVGIREIRTVAETAEVIISEVDGKLVVSAFLFLGLVLLLISVKGLLE